MKRRSRGVGPHVVSGLLSCLVSLPTCCGAGKTGAGLFMMNRDFPGEPRVLLLRRAPGSNHGNLWSIPGGNFDGSLDTSLYGTALREAHEELGSVPSFTAVRGSILVEWGDDDDNEFTVFIVETSSDNGTWRPSLSDENTDSAWFALDNLGALQDNGDLHPMVNQLVGYSAMDMIGKFEFS